MKALTTLLLVAVFSSTLAAWEFAGNLSSETRYYLNKGSYGNNEQVDLSLVTEPELYHSWDDDRKVISIIPFARVSSLDSKRSHVDIREASFIGAWDWFELRAGIAKVFWGVAESNHLIDIVNQSDLVENVDGEDKLGQPMINPTVMTNYGTISYFILPFFRERTFSGEEGRYRAGLLVDTDAATYAHSDKENHIDHALRYTHYLGNLEYGLSFFSGTDREPILTVSGSSLVPHYVQSTQYAVDAQYIAGSLALKVEALWKDKDSIGQNFASVAGYEYTFANVKNGLDIGLLTEYSYDDRGESASVGFNNHYFAGMRLSFNDEDGTEFLAGTLFDNNDAQFQSVRVETSARWNNNWRWEFELNLLFNTSDKDAFHRFRNDDYAQFAMTHYF